MTPPRIGRRALVRAFAATAIALAPSMALAGRTYQPLFRIERSKNANVVQYDAVLDTQDKLASSAPVVGYWVMKAEDGRREGFNMLDRRAYGFKVAPEKDAGSWLLYMNAMRARSIRVVRWQGRWVAETMIAGKAAVLERLFVATDESAFIPSVRWIDFYGVDMASGVPLTERVKP